MSSDMSITVKGDKKFQKKLKRFRKEVEPKKPVTKATMYLLEHITTKEIKQSGPPVQQYLVQRHGGSGVVGAIRAVVRKEGGQYVGRVGAGGLKGRILRAHEIGMRIKAKAGGFLTFKTYDGAWHSVKSVKLPKRPTFGRGMKRAKREILNILNGCIQDAKRKARV